MKILVVDDTPMMLMSIERILERNDHRVLSSGNGEEALRILQNDTSIELIITDMMMPNLSGIELYQRVQTMERFNDRGPVPTPPMILMTAHPLCQSNGIILEEFELLHSCFEAIVQKPVNEEELLVAIRKSAAWFNYNIMHLAGFRRLLQEALNETASVRSPEELADLADRMSEQLEQFRCSMHLGVSS